MIILIILSIIPLAFKQQTAFLLSLDRITVSIFIFDYVLRLFTADFKIKKGRVASFFLYPLTPMAIIDLLSILPSLSILNSSFRLFRLFRLFKTFRVFRVFKLIRYSKNMAIINNVFKKQKQSLLCVGSLAIAYILISALIIFNVEPGPFTNFFDAVYWATMSLTTIGYGDIYPITTIGKLITIVSSLFGIAIVALPAGIITAGFMEEIKSQHQE